MTVMPVEVHKLCIGTANFGLHYGINNIQGMLSNKQIREIIGNARELKITSIDSAFDYGSAHVRLNELDCSDFGLITKVKVDDSWNSERLKLKLVGLRNYRHTTLLIHNPHELTKSKLNESLKVIRDLRESGLINKFGLSIYSPHTLEDIDPNISYDCVQYPFNCFDRRMEKSGWMTELRAKNVEQIVRSIFMQGVLLKNTNTLPAYFLRWKGLFKSWQVYLKETNQTAFEASINNVISVDKVDKIIVGVDSARQLRQLCSVEKPSEFVAFENLDQVDEDLLEPFRWKIN